MDHHKKPLTIHCQINGEAREVQAWYKPYLPEYPESWMLTKGEKNYFIGYVYKDQSGAWQLFNSVAELSPEELQEVGRQIMAT